MKLQKLVYYCQAWSLVWDETLLFDERIEAWANGPVIPALYERHRGNFEVSGWNGDPSALSQAARDTIDGVIGFYGRHTAQWLSDLTHKESPWQNARTGVPSGVPCNHEITPALMAEYYGGL